MKLFGLWCCTPSFRCFVLLEINMKKNKGKSKRLGSYLSAELESAVRQKFFSSLSLKFFWAHH